MKKGQVTGQVFIYIISAVIIGFVLLFGIQAVLKILKTGCDVEMIEFKQGLEDRFKKGMQHGVVNDRPISVPSCSNFAEVCFVQLDKEAPPSLYSSRPLIYNSWEDKVEANVFFIADGPELFMYVKGLEVKNPFWLCEPVVSGRISTLRFIGQGDGILVDQI